MTISIGQVTIQICALAEHGSALACAQVRLTAASKRVISTCFTFEELAERPQRLFGLLRLLGEPLLIPKAKNDLLSALQVELQEACSDESLPRLPVADRTGWCGCTFVTPTHSFPKGGVAPLAALPAGLAIHNYEVRGSLKKWRRKHRFLLRRNPLFAFAASAALAAPLLELVDRDGCVFVFHGMTSSGKSTLLRFMGSMRGGRPDRKLGHQASWRTTVNALETIASSANDGLLVLDDLRNLPGDSRQRAAAASEALYTLTTGRQKARLTDAMPPTPYRILVATSDNQSLRELLAEGGVRHDESMAVRLIGIPVARQYGVFDKLPRRMLAADYADKLTRRSRDIYGAPIRAFLEHLTSLQMTKGAVLQATIEGHVTAFRLASGMQESSGHIRRVLDYFALTYAAGLLAIDAKILPLRQPALLRSIVDVYRTHRQAIGDSAAALSPLELLRGSIGALKFFDLRKGARSDAIQGSPPGFVTSKREDCELSFTPDQFRRLIPAGLSTKRLCDLLRKSGYLISDGGASQSTKNQTKRRIQGKRVRVYCVSGRFLSSKSEE